MRKTFLLFSIFLSLRCFGQSNERSWEEGKLTWDDFKVEALTSGPQSSELNYQLSYATTKRKVGDTVLVLFQTKNSMNPNLSRVKESTKSTYLLRYNQVMFNIAELYRRKLQRQLHRIDNPYNAGEKSRIQYQNCNFEIQQLQNDTRQGTDSVAIAHWDDKISQELEATPLESVPSLSDRNFGIGIHIGLGTGIFTGRPLIFSHLPSNWAMGSMWPIRTRYYCSIQHWEATKSKKNILRTGPYGRKT